MRISLSALIAVLVLALAACGEEDERSSIDPNAEQPPAATEPQDEAAPGADLEKPEVEVPEEKATRLETEDLEEGDGATAGEGDTVTVHYVGVSQSTGEEFDASYGAQPFEFELGAGDVIDGWDRGVEGMKEGGRRRLVIPARLGYGRQGSPPNIAPGETLVFVVDLIEVN